MAHRNQARALILVLLLAGSPALAAPVVFYTDIDSGPHTGGEDNKGTYLSIFGVGFGSSKGTSQVFINNVEVGAYKYWGPANGGWPGIQQISVQPGAAVSSGPVKVVVDGVSSNVDMFFAVRPGDIFFTSLSGNDATGVVGSITQPFRTANTVVKFNGDPASEPIFGPGDTLVVRGGAYTEKNDFDSFITLRDKQVEHEGTPSDPLMLMVYPGEDAVWTPSSPKRAVVHIHNTETRPQKHIVVSGFTSVGTGGVVWPAFDDDLRVVNNDQRGLHSEGSGTGAYTGGGSNIKVFGNTSGDNGDNKLVHNFYIDNENEDIIASNIEVAWNWSHHQVGGRGIQVFPGSSEYKTACLEAGGCFFGVAIHDNLIHDINLSGITVSEGVVTAQVYGNVLYRVGGFADCLVLPPSCESPSCPCPGGDAGGIQVKSLTGSYEIYNNTIFDVEVQGAFFNSLATSVKFKNNLIYVLPGQKCWENTGATWDAKMQASNNLYFGCTQGKPSWDQTSLLTDPLLNNPTAANFHQLPTSPTINAGALLTPIPTRDFDGVGRPQGPAFDIGAYEFVSGGAQCGDGVVNAGEGCDDGNSASETCAYGDSPPFAQVCLANCQTGNCLNPQYCGDGTVQLSETCDGSNLNGQSCQTILGPGNTGTLSCHPSCGSFVTTSCVGPPTAPGGILFAGSSLYGGFVGEQPDPEVPVSGFTGVKMIGVRVR